MPAKPPARTPAKTPAKSPATTLPTRQQILDFISASRDETGKREIAKAFGIRGPLKIQLKALLKDMTDEGLVDLAPGRSFIKHGGLPKVTVLRIADVDGSTPYAVPERWEGQGPPPRVGVVERGRRSALGVGDRILARIEEAGAGYRAHPIRKLESSAEDVVGVLADEAGPSGKPMLMLRSVDKRVRQDWRVSDAGGGKVGDLVVARLSGPSGRQSAVVGDVLGDPFAPRALSLIAIHKFGLRHLFSEEVIADAERVARLPIDDVRREDLTDLPIVAIDPRDARDHDDALWAAPDEDASNPGGYRAIVAIADVSFYVRPGSPLDREARARGNSVYFPDLVVPMLPHILSSGVCSLKAGEDRASLVCHLTIDARGKVTRWRFARARVRLVANLAYEDAQAMIDAREAPPYLAHLWAAWRLVARARDERAPLELDLPERQVLLDDKGRIREIRVRERLDAHRLVEDFMIAANVAAAKALESKKSPVMYRVHEPPAREKLVALKDFLATYDMPFALGQVMTPAMFNRLVARVEEPEVRARIMEQLLRTQTQAYYAPVNAGHFGLALGSYAHFTSPIRRYADLLVHRALVAAFDLEAPRPADRAIPPHTALDAAEGKAFVRIGEQISAAERRAMEAERETIDRYVAAYLAERVGEVLPTRITGVRPFGFFAQVVGVGGDGLVPVSALGQEYFRWDEAAQALIGEQTGTRYASGEHIDLRLVDANVLTGGLMFALPDADPSVALRRRGRDGGKDKGARRPVMGRRGRPPNIRHQSR